MGDLLRAHAEEPLGEQKAHIQTAMSKGSLVAPAYVQKVLGGHIDQLVLKGRTRFLIDGFPRSKQQAQNFQDQARLHCAFDPDEAELIAPLGIQD